MKDFCCWHCREQKIERRKSRFYFHEREIWFTALGVNIGHEQDGTGKNFDRPIVILRKFSEKIFFGVALTTKSKDNEYYFSLGEIDNKESVAILSQVRLIDAKRLVRKIGMLEEEVFKTLKEKIKEILF